MFMGPCIVKHFYSKTNQMHNFRVYWMSLYTFRTVFPSIIRSSRLYTQLQVYVIQVRYMFASRHEISCLLANRQQTCMMYTWSCVYSLELLMMDGKTVRNVEW